MYTAEVCAFAILQNVYYTTTSSHAVRILIPFLVGFIILAKLEPNACCTTIAACGQENESKDRKSKIFSDFVAKPMSKKDEGKNRKIEKYKKYNELFFCELNIT